MPFAPGQSGNPGGRPPKDGPKWSQIAYWFHSIQKDLPELSPIQRVEIAKWAMEFLVDNVKALPSQVKKPEEQAAQLLASLEAHGNQKGS